MLARLGYAFCIMVGHLGEGRGVVYARIHPV